MMSPDRKWIASIMLSTYHEFQNEHLGNGHLAYNPATKFFISFNAFDMTEIFTSSLFTRFYLNLAFSMWSLIAPKQTHVLVNRIYTSYKTYYIAAKRLSPQISSSPFCFPLFDTMNISSSLGSSLQTKASFIITIFIKKLVFIVIITCLSILGAETRGREQSAISCITNLKYKVM